MRQHHPAGEARRAEAILHDPPIQKSAPTGYIVRRAVRLNARQAPTTGRLNHPPLPAICHKKSALWALVWRETSAGLACGSLTRFEIELFQ
ncbi:hypothetical protein NB716_001684 [Pantoea ananatis]|nr:hypothetical protein [Pantoea ananatis]